MNQVILCGRLARDPETKYSTGEEQKAISKYTLAVDRKTKGEADFIKCVAFGRAGEFAEKYLRQGMKILIRGRIQTGSYTNRDGQKVNTTEIIVEDHEFCEKKASQEASPKFSETPDDNFLPF